MVWSKHLSRFTILAVALTLGLTTNVPAQVQAQLKPSSPSSKPTNQSKNSFRPPRTSTPVNTQGGASRGPACLDKDSDLKPIPLVPVDSQMGETVADYPTFFWYMPETSAPEVEFVLRDENNKDVYRVKYALAKSAEGGTISGPGLMSLTLPAFANVSPLEIGKKYSWYVALVCDPIDRSKGNDIVGDGSIKRVAADPALAVRIQQATPQQRVALYRDAQLWHDAVSTLVELQRTRPDDANLPVAWDRLLSSAGL
jgi:hypothetical protein